MKSVYTRCLLSLSFLMISSVLWACPAPNLPFRQLVGQADLIVGIQLSTLDLTKQTQGYRFHQLIKGEHPDKYIMGRMPYILEHHDRVMKNVIYAIAFLDKRWGEEAPRYRACQAKNAVLFFSTMEEVTFAIKRLNKIYAIQQNENVIQRDQESFSWLLDHLERKSTGVVKPQFTLVDHHYWYNDALWDLSLWQNNNDDLSDPLGRKLPDGEHQGGDLSVISDEDKARCFKIYKGERYASTDFSRVVLSLGFDKEVYPSILEKLYDELENDYSSSGIANLYQDLLLPITLPKEDETYLAKLILFNYKGKLLREIEQNKDLSKFIFIDCDGLVYLEKRFQSERFSRLLEDWQVYLKTHEIRTVYDLSLFHELMDEAEKHLNMCNDPRINQLTGKRKLWNCANESAFAAAETFEEGSIETTIYPNPSNGNFTIKLKLEKEAKVQLTLENVDGQQIIQQELESNNSRNERFHFQQELNLEGLPTGVYLFTIRQHNKVFTEKLMIQ